jgi:two-component system cell cycle sensor histidine kinase/response regulator CckA
MTQENPQRNKLAEAGEASSNSGAHGLGEPSGPASAGVFSASTSSGTSGAVSAAPGKSSSSDSTSSGISGSSSESAVNHELRRLNRSLHALSACNQALAQAGSEQELLRQICDIIVRVGGYRMAGIAYAEQDEEKTVRPMAHAGHGSGYLETIHVKWSDTPAGRGPAGTAIRENRICVIIDTANDPVFAPWREAALQRGYAAVIALPLRVAGASFGVLAIYSEQAGSFESSEVELLSEMANNLAFGIAAIRSQEEGRRVTAALQDAERRYRQLVEQVPAISYIAEPGEAGRFHYISPQVEHILGFTPREWMADDHTWFNVLHPDDREKTIAAEHRREGELYRVEYRTRARDGREVWLRDDAVFVRDVETGKLLMRGLLVDVTERRRADEALRRSEENYRMFVAQSSEGIFRLDLDAPLSIDLPEKELARRIHHDSYMAECNQAMANMYAVSSPTDLLGKRLTELLVDDPQNLELTREYIRNGFRVLERESHEMDVNGNRKVFLNSMFGIVENGKLFRTWGIQRDITERLKAEEARHKAEEALRESEERYRVFVAQSSEGIYRTEHDPPVPVNLPLKQQMSLALQSGYVAECNDAMARMYGLNEAGELLGKKLSQFLIADDPVTKEFMAVFIQSGYRITDWESHERDAQGRMKIFRNTMVGIVDKGCLVRTWGIQRDVTERIQLEEQLRNAQQLEAIGRLAGGVAHDFNNILSIIMGHGELLLATAGDDERARNGLEQIRRAADRAASLTQQLLAFSRRQVLQPKVLDLNEAVADVQKMLSRVIGEDIQLVASLHPSLVPVKADPGQVEQVLMNLAINARDAMPHGGNLTMETSNVDVELELARDLELVHGAYVMLKVSDSGHGMDAETVLHIFEPFFTTKPMGKGTGLGLSTVYGIVKQSGGSIQVESEEGRGTTFRIYLPVAEGAMGKRQELVASDKIAGGTETILLTEDEPDLRELARIFLEGYGYKVLEAASAEQAIRTANLFAGHIDLLLTDVIMPGMSGSQLAENILTQRPQTKIVYMTGYTDDMVVQHKVLEPGVKLLQKPFSKADLALKVRSTLDGK